MKLRADTIISSFLVALFSSFLVALAALLIETLALTRLDSKLYADVTVNILLLLIFAVFIFFKGSTLAAWLIYRHDVEWGYKLEKKKIIPIFILSFTMALIVYYAVFLYTQGELQKLAYVDKSIEFIEKNSGL